MEDKKAAKILVEMIKKYELTADEKEAVSEAVGVLSWTSLAEDRIKRIKRKKDRMLE